MVAKIPKELAKYPATSSVIKKSVAIKVAVKSFLFVDFEVAFCFTDKLIHEVLLLLFNNGVLSLVDIIQAITNVKKKRKEKKK